MERKNKRICKNGHEYYKSSDCPVCPICEQENKPEDGFLAALGAPARRALQSADLTTITKLSKVTEEELLSLHGFGPSSLPELREVLQQKGLSLKK